jgi:hypothetical protein
MAALSITASNVLLYTGTPLADQVAGAAFTAGAAVYKSDSGTWLKAQCDGTAVEAGANGIGIALGTADVAGARVSIAGPGCKVTLGTGTAGVPYFPGATAGNLNELADLATTNKVTIACIGIGSNRVLVVGAYDAGSVVP